MKYLILLIALTSSFNSHCQRVEKIYQECLHNRLSNKGEQLKNEIQKYEQFLIAQKHLKDSTSISYYNLWIKSRASEKKLYIGCEYSFIDSIKKLKNSHLIIRSDSCFNKMMLAKNYKNSLFFKKKKAIDSIYNESSLSEKEKKKMISNSFSIHDFKLEFYRLRLLTSINFTTIKKLND